MADTRVQLEVEDWVRREYLPRTYGRPFRRDRLRLTSGGVFDFDGVSDDGTIVVSISTSGSRTATGKQGVGKMLKIRSDMFFLLLTETRRRIVVLTERDMFEQCQKELESGRVPSSIEFVHAEIPGSLAQRLRTARQLASKETTPGAWETEAINDGELRGFIDRALRFARR